MKITIYAKRRQTKDGKTFYSYLSTLTRKDGSTVTVGVKFRDEAGQPKPDKCPMNIVVDKVHANLTGREYVKEETGELTVQYTLWVSKWNEGEPFVDHSLDDFE